MPLPFPLPFLMATALLATPPASGDRWRLDAKARRITWQVDTQDRLPHVDRVELSGKRAAAWIAYGADATGHLTLSHWCVWPTLRVAPNDTHSSLMVRFHPDRAPEWMNRKAQPLETPAGTRFRPRVTVEGREPVGETLERAVFEQGLLRLDTRLVPGLRLQRDLMPSAEGTAILEAWTLHNDGETPLQVAIDPLDTRLNLPYDYVDKGLFQAGRPAPATQRKTGTYGLSVSSAGLSPRTLAPGESVRLSLAFTAWDAAGPRPDFDLFREQEARMTFARELREALRFECPDPILETAFDFAKLRACESIIATAHGPMHAPGGGTYYAALWANDSVEYVAPFYPFTGYAYGNAASLNAFRHYARYLNAEGKPLPSSIVAEGTDTWQDVGDRGDQAMIAYGVSRTLLALGDAQEARRHWPLVTWCLDYLETRRTPQGIYTSDTDELEGRFSAGKTNLNTNLLAYGGLKAAADLAQELGEPDRAATYRQRAQALRGAVEKHFGATVRGFQTYRYHEGLEELRAWICIPLTMGLLERKEGTLAALFSPRLWTADGLLTTESAPTFWDRSTLYALRGVFQAGAPDLALPRLQALSRRRLLGEHVPYVVEAYPEGNGRHLSAESALYGRIVTEGLFGLEPTGFRRFTLKPSLPTAWPRMALRDVRAFASRFDLEVSRPSPGRLEVRVLAGGKVLKTATLPEGESLDITLPR